MITIHVNSNKCELPDTAVDIGYDTVVELAGFRPFSYYTVVWHRGTVEKPEGIMAYNDRVKLKDGMRFEIAYTGAA